MRARHTLLGSRVRLFAVGVGTPEGSTIPEAQSTGTSYQKDADGKIVMSRLGHAVRNDVVVTVPVFRSRTRMKDVVIDLAAIPLAAWRVSRRRSGRRRCAQQWSR